MTATNNHRRSTQPGTPTLVEHNHLKFLIINKPSAATLPQFIKVCSHLHQCTVMYIYTHVHVYAWGYMYMYCIIMHVAFTCAKTKSIPVHLVDMHFTVCQVLPCVVVTLCSP